MIWNNDKQAAPNYCYGWSRNWPPILKVDPARHHANPIPAAGALDLALPSSPTDPGNNNNEAKRRSRRVGAKGSSGGIRSRSRALTVRARRDSSFSSAARPRPGRRQSSATATAAAAERRWRLLASERVRPGRNDLLGRLARQRRRPTGVGRLAPRRIWAVVGQADGWWAERPGWHPWSRPRDSRVRSRSI